MFWGKKSQTLMIPIQYYCTYSTVHTYPYVPDLQTVSEMTAITISGDHGSYLGSYTFHINHSKSPMDTWRTSVGSKINHFTHTISYMYR